MLVCSRLSAWFGFKASLEREFPIDLYQQREYLLLVKKLDI